MTLRRKPAGEPPAPVAPAEPAAPDAATALQELLAKDNPKEARRRAKETDAAMRDAGIETSADAQRGALPIGDLPVMSGGFDRIVERIFDLPDPEGEYVALEAAMQVGSRKQDDVYDALDKAEENARRAHRLFVNAKVDLERYNADADLVQSGLWSAATAELQNEKAGGQRSKAITNDDIKHHCAAMFPDEWRDLQERSAKAKQAVAHLERFADLWQKRCMSLSSMLQSRRA